MANVWIIDPLPMIQDSMEAYREKPRRYAVYYEWNLVYHIIENFSKSVVRVLQHRQVFQGFLH